MAVPIKSPAEIDAMAEAGRALDTALVAGVNAAVAGATTGDVGAAVDQAICDAGAEPVFAAFVREGEGGGATEPFGAAACVCVNEEVVHSRPRGRLLRPGDVVTIDAGLELGGWCVDAARSAVVGGENAQAEGLEPSFRPVDDTMPPADLAAAAHEIAMAVVERMRPGERWRRAVEAAESAARRHGVALIGGYAGHGIGRSLHEAPALPFVLQGGSGVDEAAKWAEVDIVLRPGMVVTVEPLVGRAGVTTLGLEDGWTVVTADRSWAAGRELTVAITLAGPRVLAGG